jgi:hypothetical protein
MKTLSQNWVVAALAATWLAAQNVGIGTTTPLTRLHVAAGDIFLGEATGANGFVLHSRVDAGYDFFQISTRTGGTYEWGKGITLVRSSGNVGIGTTMPGAKLHVYDDSNGEIRLEGVNKARFLAYSGGDLWIQSGSSWTSGSTADIRFSGMFGSPIHMTIQGSTGNVGIGTTAPGYRLDIAGALRLQPGSAPAGANGVIYYDATANKFKCFENGAWRDCIGSAEVRWTPTPKIPLGSLPANPIGTVVFPIPASIPTTAKEVLVYAYIRTGYNYSSSLREDDIEFKIYTEESGVQYAHYLFAHWYPQNAWSYNSGTFWLPITSAREIRVTSTGTAPPDNGNYVGEIFIIGYR